MEEKLPELELLLQNKIRPWAGGPSGLQSRGDATARVSAAEAPCEQGSVLCSPQSKTKQDSKGDLDDMRERGTLYVSKK